ncbi:nif-specific transcriptional activator NifA [Agaribacterium haliotis]|uniref:nif-specific transcriptional activator NifA n=1 Tax=Agaribacterium haliotis TaxID=2013869 RepID=UPI001EFD295C|nr:nif-specific transcriptional activator NifA [Agaribacterium haliotis]
MMMSKDSLLSATPALSRASLLENETSALNKISQIVCHSDNIEKTFDEVLQVLHTVADLHYGLISISDAEHSAVQLTSIYTGDDNSIKPGRVKYRSGEGIIGRILSHGNPIVLGRISSEPNFLDRLAIYDYELPFIAVPIENCAGKTIGVLAAQPSTPADDLLSVRLRFMETVAHMLSQTVRLVINVERGEELASERDELRREVRANFGFEKLVIGHTSSMRRVFDQVRRVAKWDSTVLVLGESGTGKELISTAIHYNSPRAKQAYVRLNCAALPETLLESELFGHEKGAFTGAVKQRKGRFEQADGGTLFLDEIGEISPMFQAKLLRILQEGEFERVGGTQTIKVDLRIVAATNRTLEAEVDKGKFREDLYYRLNVMPIQIPPLRERKADIPELAEFLLGKIAEKQKRELKLTNSAVRMLMNYHWPGNVRELENCLERAAVMSEQGNIDSDVISLSGVQYTQAPIVPHAQLKQTQLTPSQLNPTDLHDNSLDERERVIAALEQAGWVQAKAARLLNMTPRQIAYRIQTLNINVRKI